MTTLLNLFREKVYDAYTRSGFLPVEKVEKAVSDETPVKYQGRPFTWDRPGVGLYKNGELRIVFNDADGKLTYCRAATDEEVRFIMLYEKMEELFNTRSIGVSGEDFSFRREPVFAAMRETDFKRTYSCCPTYLEKMCNGDEYKGNLEGFLKNYLRRIGVLKPLNT